MAKPGSGPLCPEEVAVAKDKARNAGIYSRISLRAFLTMPWSTEAVCGVGDDDPIAVVSPSVDIKRMIQQITPTLD